VGKSATLNDLKRRNDVKNGDDILLDVHTTAAQSGALVSDKAQNRTF